MRALDEIARLVAGEDRWASDAYAYDAAGEPLSAPQDIRARAVRWSVLGAVEAISSEYEMHIVVTGLLREVIALAGAAHARAHGAAVAPRYFAGTEPFNRWTSQQQVLHVVTAARERAATLPAWPTHANAPGWLPDGPASPDEAAALCFEQQCIDLYFEYPHGPRWSATPTMINAVVARSEAIAAYARAHPLPREPIPLRERASALAREYAHPAATWAVRRWPRLEAPAGRWCGVGADEDTIPF